MATGKTMLMWGAVALGVTALAAVACGGSTEPEPETPTPGPTTVVVAQDARDGDEAAMQAYADEVRAISERIEAERREVFDRPPGPASEMAELAEALPQVIEGVTANIAALEALDVPEEYTEDHDYTIAFLGDQLALLRRQLQVVEARDELALRELRVESDRLARNLMSDLSESFREFFLVSEEAVEAGEVFGDLNDEESAYLDTVSAGFEEFGKRNAVFGQTLSRQFSDTQALLEALRGAGAGTAFEAVRDVIERAKSPPRFEKDHELLLGYLDVAVEMDRRIGQAIEDGDAVAFVVSNFGILSDEASVRAALDMSPQVRGIVLPFLNSALRPPGPDVLDGGYRERLYAILRELGVRFPRPSPNYLAFNLLPEDAYQVISQTAPGFIGAVEKALEGVSALTPPEELRADHDRLVAHLEGTIAAQEAIVTASESKDLSDVRERMSQAGTLYCEAFEGFSDAMRPVVLVLLGDQPPQCGPPPSPR